MQNNREELELQKLKYEAEIKAKELEIKAKELAVKEQELAEKSKPTKKSFFSSSPVGLAILGGIITIFTDIIAKSCEHRLNYDMEKKKMHLAILQKSLETKDPEQMINYLSTTKKLNLMGDIDSNEVNNLINIVMQKQKDSLESAINTQIPKLFSDKPEEKLQAQVIISQNPALADEVAVKAERTLSKNNFKSLKSLIDSAKTVNPTRNKWIIVISSDKTIKEAQTEQNKAKELGFDTKIYKRNELFMTAVGDYETKDQCLKNLFSIKQKLNRDAFTVNKINWCRKEFEENKNEGYYECK
jgi:hypothetical protein